MEIYRLKHLPTGLYYTPSRGSGNLSPKGKLYAGAKPQIGWTSTIRIQIRSFRKEPTGHHKIIVEYFGIKWTPPSRNIDINVSTHPSHWEIETVTNET